MLWRAAVLENLFDWTRPRRFLNGIDSVNLRLYEWKRTLAHSLSGRQLVLVLNKASSGGLDRSDNCVIAPAFKESGGHLSAKALMGV